MKSLYLAGGSDERLTIVRPMIERITIAGIPVTYDWTRSPGYDRPLSPEEVRAQASLDLEAVRAADIVWVLCPEAKSEGAATELGAALILGKTVLLSGPFALRDSRIFNRLASHVLPTHERGFSAAFDLAMGYGHRDGRPVYPGA